MSYNIAVLECDTPVESVVATRGTYGDIFRQLIQGSLAKTHVKQEKLVTTTSWDVVVQGNYPDLKAEKPDAIVLTGSKHTAFHDDPWIVKLVDFVRQVFYNTDIPIMGICFGHQIIGRALGARVGVSNGGWEISACELGLNDEGSKLFGTRSLVLHQMHRDAVLSLPDGAINLGSSNRCSIQGMAVPGKMISLQAHPEFDQFIMERIIETRQRQNVFDDTMAEDGLARAAYRHNGPEVFSAMLRYILDM